MINAVKSAWRSLTRISSKDPDEARHEYMTRLILLVMSVMSFFFVIILSFGYYFSVISVDLFFIMLIMFILFLTGFYLTGYGQWKLCRYIPMILFLLAGIYGIFIDGLYSSAMLTFILAIILAMIFFQWIGQIIIISVSIISFISLSLAHYFGYLTALRVETERFTNRIIIVSLVFLTIASLLRLLINQMNNALKTSRARGEELEGINEELQAAMEELEATTEEFEAQNEELIRTNIEIENSEEKFRSMIQSSTDMIFIIGTDGTFTYESPSVERILGYKKDYFIGQSPLSLIHPDDLEIVLKELDDVYKSVNSGIPTEFRMRRADGTWTYIEALGSNLLENKAVNGVVITARDISERKRAEEALQLSEVTYREIFNTINDTIWVHDVETLEFLDVNKNVTEMFGYSVEEALKLNMEDISSGIPPYIKETGMEYLRKTASGQPQIFEWECKHKDGHVFWTEVNLKRGVIAGKECILAIERDITERKLAEEQRDALQAQLLQAQKMESVGRLAGGVAHDFNNMLSAILGHTELAMMKHSPSDPVYADLNIIKDSAIRSADLTRQLLAFARKQTISPKVLNLNDQITSMLKMLLRLIGEDIDLIWKPGVNLWEIKIDPSQLDQLLANICINARDAISGIGKVTIETDNIIFDSDYCNKHKGFISGEFVMFAVSDDGAGMTKEILNHLFEPFFTTKEVGKGTGLGLATVYGIVKQNEGFINVYSEPDKGSVFKIYLPRYIGEAVKPSVEIHSNAARGNGEMVLLVEDEEMILNVTKNMLEELGYAVETASKPGEALLKAKEFSNEIKLLITDVVMPEMNGRDLSKMILEINQDIKCLFISGYTANAIAHRGVLDEGVFFLEKPFSIKDLGEKIRDVLEIG